MTEIVGGSRPAGPTDSDGSSSPNLPGGGRVMKPRSRVELVREKVDEVRAVAHRDPELAHGLEDELMRTVLRTIANFPATIEEASLLCSVALDAAAIDYPRWTA